jgi:hypothetical protein
MRLPTARSRFLTLLLILILAPLAFGQSQQRERRMPTAREERPEKFDPPRGGSDSLGLTPLSELETGLYKGETGGLYGDGKNEPPDSHARALQRQLSMIRPLDRRGKPAPDGRIGLLSIGMSNTHAEFGWFQRLAKADPAKDPSVVLVDGAQGGNDAVHWAANRISPRTGRPLWTRVEEKLKAASLTSPQVQVAWVKLVIAYPMDHGEFPDHARALQREIAEVLRILKSRYPNTRIAYISSRIYAGYSESRLSPDPYAYESAFSVRWLIEQQISGDPKLNFDPERGEAVAPLVIWGPYMWADGVRPRAGDGLTWQREEFNRDGVHPSQIGLAKVSRLLLEFFQKSPSARSWYLARPSE